MFIELDYSYFSAFDLEMKATKIFKYILHFCEEKHEQKRTSNYQVLRKYLSRKLFFCAP